MSREKESSSVTAPAAAPPKTKQTTEYVVLRENVSEPNSANSRAGTHSVVTIVDAANSNDAIRQAAGDKPGVYRAIPARSWKPVKVTVHTETTIRLG